MIRSGYSFRNAFGHLEDVHSRVMELGWNAAPLADTNSTFGFVRWNKLCSKAGIKPVFGVELSVVPSLGEKKPTVDRWTFLAIDELRPLHELVALATANPGKEPSLTYAQATTSVGVFRIAGERARLDQFQPSPTTFVGLSPSVSRGHARAVEKAGFRWLARSDNVFPRAVDKELFRVALGFRAFTQTYPQFILTDAEWREALFFGCAEETKTLALAARDEVLARCGARLIKAELLTPEKPTSLREMCLAGGVKLGLDLNNEIYSERLNRELALIAEKEFEDYFYILSDMIMWAKQRMIVGPARGSSCGSLVCYLLGITSINPIPYGLIFERFIDINRQDLPDVDIDFSSTRRDLVFEYAEKTYGSDHVARLGTVGLFKPRSALKQAAASLRIPGWLVERTLEGVVERSGGDSRAMLALEDTLNETEMGRKLLREFPEARLAAKMEGHPNNPSQHAAGVVITKKPIVEYVAFDSRTRSIMADKKDAEEMNLLKIDALGLTQLSIFERTLQLAGKPDISGFLEDVPLDDPLAFAVLNEGRFAGIFQFTGTALKSLTKQIVIRELNDMVSITALARPGPMATGGASAWARRKRGEERIETLHPLLTELTRDTFGVTIYQEQVMQIVRVLGKMSWEDTSAIRKAMSGRLGNEFFEKYWLKFRAGASENGIEENTSKQIWDQINTFGSWAFNKSHAVAYGIVSYYCCWLKAHYSAEFAAATLDAESEPSKQISLLRELRDEGIDYVPVDIDHSTERWGFKEIEGRRVLVGPLTAIKGIGPASVNEILTARKRGEPIRASLAKKIANGKTEIDTLFPIADAVKRLHPDLSASARIVTEPTPVKSIQCGINGEVVALAVIRKIAPKDENANVNVMKRGYKVTGPTSSLNLFVADDTDEIFCKVNRFKFEALGRAVIERGGVGKALYAIKGRVPPGFRMIDISAIRYLGDLE